MSQKGSEKILQPVGRLEFELSNGAPDVGNDIISCIDHTKVEKANQLVEPDGPPLMRSLVSFQRRHQLQMAAARRKECVMSLSDTSDQLYSLFDGATGHVDGEVSLAALPSLTALDEMYVDKFSHALKAGELSDMVVLRPENELNSSSLLD